MKIRRSSLSEINVTSLVDVTMVLLIIFIITAPTLQEWVDLKLPKAKVEKSDIKEGIVISVTKDGSIFLDKTKISYTNFDAEFSEVWRKGSINSVFLRADRGVEYGKVVDIIGKIKALGREELGLIVESEHADAN